MTQQSTQPTRQDTSVEPIVSIVIPAYNAGKWLAEGLGCLRMQDFPSFEAIVVDDGSTDDTYAIVEALSAIDGRFSVVRQDNAGAGVARNVGMERARGRYLLFLDADDLFEPTMLSRMVSVLETGTADFVVCGADIFVDDPSQPLKTLPTHRGLAEGAYELEPLRDQLYQVLMAHPWDKLIRTSLVREYGLRFQALTYDNDTLFVCAMAACAQRMGVVDEVLVHYRKGVSTSQLATAKLEPLCDLQALDALREYLLQTGNLDDHLKRSLDNLCVDVVIHDVAAYATSSREALEKYADAYFDGYEARWGLCESTRHRYPYLHSLPQAMAYESMRKTTIDGLVWACRRRHEGRANIGRGTAEKLLLAVRLMAVSLPCSPFRRRRGI